MRQHDLNEPPVRESETPYYIQATAALSPGRTLVLKQDDTFGVFDSFGDIDGTTRGDEGIFHYGTRFLSRLRLLLLGARPLLLSSTVRRDNVLLVADLTNPDIYRHGLLLLPHGALHIYRSYFLWHGILHMSLRVHNFSLVPADLELALEVRADYVDIFEVRGQQRPERGTLRDPSLGDGGRDIVIEYAGLDGVERRTVIETSFPATRATPQGFHFNLCLWPGEERSMEFAFRLEIGAARIPDRAPAFAADLANASARSGLQTIPQQIVTSNEQFDTWLERSREDLNMLLTNGPLGMYPYAGVPWFSCPFGRDGIITALECLWAAPDVARGVLTYLAATQATESSDARDSQPGKILHEARDGEMAARGEIPFRRYYGSVDATPLFVALAAAYYRRTADLPLIESLWPHIASAMEWIDRYGDVDQDGFVEYESKSPNGLRNQGWKDSQDSIFHSDGRLAEGPIALCEVQGYVYCARRSAGELAAVLGKDAIADDQREMASRLKKNFDERFWCDSISSYALALDGDKRRCEVRASNAGHTLFSRIAESSRAALIVDQLGRSDFQSGWGIRTLAATEARYNPMSYHNGSIWPHDNALIADGYKCHGFTNQAAMLLRCFFEASTQLNLNRLPELFCGFPRRPGKGPTLYPVACSPQAWSAGAAFLLLQSSIGLSIDAIEKRIILSRPVLLPFLERVHIRGMSVGDASADLMLFRSDHSVAVTVERRTGDLEVLVVN